MVIGSLCPISDQWVNIVGEDGASAPNRVKPSLDTYAGPFRTSIRPEGGGDGGYVSMYVQINAWTYGMVLHMCLEEKVSPPSGPMPKRGREKRERKEREKRKRNRCESVSGHRYPDAPL